jgi:hypothetical protein
VEELVGVEDPAGDRHRRLTGREAAVPELGFVVLGDELEDSLSERS